MSLQAGVSLPVGSCTSLLPGDLALPRDTPRSCLLPSPHSLLGAQSYRDPLFWDAWGHPGSTHGGLRCTDTPKDMHSLCPRVPIAGLPAPPCRWQHPFMLP